MPGNRAPERAEGVGGEGRKVQPGRASPAPHPPSGTQLASFYVRCWCDSRGWGGPSGGHFSAPSAPRSEVLILFPSPSLLSSCI